MPIRSATYSDLLPASKCLARAFKDEPLFGKYLHPHRERYPEGMSLYFLSLLRNVWASGPDQHLIVSYTPSNFSDNTSSSNSEIITGLAHWSRMRSVPQDSLLQRIKKRAMQWYTYLQTLIYTNRALDPGRTGVFPEMEPFCKHFWTGSRAEVWDLKLLGVDPAAGGKGHGKELVGWGFEQAKREAVGCSVTGAEGTEAFYQRCGFDIVVGGVRDNGGERNPLVKNGIPGGTILFWDNGRDVSGVRGYEEH